MAKATLGLLNVGSAFFARLLAVLLARLAASMASLEHAWQMKPPDVDLVRLRACIACLLHMEQSQPFGARAAGMASRMFACLCGTCASGVNLLERLVCLLAC